MNALDGRGAEPPPAPPISRRTAWCIALGGAASFIIAILLMAFGPDLAESTVAGPSAFSSSALGHRALRRFLEESGLTVQLRRSHSFFKGRRDVPLLVAEPEGLDGGTDPEATGVEYLGELAASTLRAGIPLFLVLPKWRGRPVPTRAGTWVEGVELRDEREAEEILGRCQPPGSTTAGVTRRRLYRPQDLPCHTAWGEELVAQLIAPQLLERSPGLEPVVWTDEGLLVGRLQPEDAPGPLYVVSDPDLLNNHGLPRRDNAVLVLRLLTNQVEARGVVFDEIVHGLGREVSFMAETLRFPLVLNILHGALVFLLVLWAGMGRFGKPLPSPPRLAAGPLGLIENTAELLTRRGRLVESSARYFDVVVQDVARRSWHGRDVAAADLIGELQRLSARRGREVELLELREQMRDAPRERKKVEASAIAAAQTLHRWREEMLHGN